MRASRLAALGLVLLVASVLTPLGGATSPGKNGRIAYMLKDGTDHWQVWVASGRLANPRRLTNEPADNGWVVWSPDGKTLAFDSNRTDPDPNDSDVVNDVFSMRPDGSEVRVLTDSKGLSGEPAWSPDGAFIAMVADRGDPAHEQGIYLMNAAGTDVRRVTVPPAGFGDGKPRFSPNGKQLAFTRFRGKDREEKAAVFTVGIDGTRLHRLTAFAVHADDLDWSPDGKHIAFDGYPNPDAYGDIYVVSATGGKVRNLTRNPAGKAGSADPVWSPDGKRILFLDNRVIRGKPRTGLATMRPDGTARRFLSARNVEMHQPDWESVH